MLCLVLLQDVIWLRKATKVMQQATSDQNGHLNVNIDYFLLSIEYEHISRLRFFKVCIRTQTTVTVTKTKRSSWSQLYVLT